MKTDEVAERNSGRSEELARAVTPTTTENTRSMIDMRKISRMHLTDAPDLSAAFLNRPTLKTRVRSVSTRRHC